MLNRLTTVLAFKASRTFPPKKVKSIKSRINHYSKDPDHYKLVTLIRPPDLKDKNLTFPIRIPIRYRHRRHIKK